MATDLFEYQYSEYSIGLGRMMESEIFGLERDFERDVVIPFPYEVRFSDISDETQLDTRILNVGVYLVRWPPHTYVAFPSSAIGRYKHCACNSVFFKDPNHAMQLKLAFLV